MIGPLAGLPIAQVGIAVNDLDDAVAAWAEAGPWRIWTYGPETIPELWPSPFSLRIALNSDTPQLELVQALSGPTPYDGRPRGLHHVAVIVPSVADAVAEMDAAGIGCLAGGAGYGLDGDGGFAYFDTVESLGIILEAIEIPRRRREPETVAPPPP